MILSAKQLLNLAVITRLGQPLGRVSDIEYDTEQQHIVRYQVTTPRTLRRLSGGPLLVHQTQVVSVSSTEMVVDDTVTPTVSASASVTAIASPSATASLSSLTNNRSLL